MPKERVSIFLEPSDRDDVRAIKLARRLDSDSAAIRFAIREVAEQLKGTTGVEAPG